MDNILTVGKLKDLLQQSSDNLPVGVLGHFGEFYPMGTIDFCERTAFVSTHRHDKVMVLAIVCPDIGIEPD